jgi:hypothetical protein
MILTLILSLFNMCRIRIRKRSPAMRGSQTKHLTKRNQRKATLLKTDPNVHLPTESDKVPALPKKAMLQVAVALWRKMVVAMKKIQNHLLCLAVHLSDLVEGLYKPPVKFRTVGKCYFPFEVSSRELFLQIAPRKIFERAMKKRTIITEMHFSCYRACPVPTPRENRLLQLWLVERPA